MKHGHELPAGTTVAFSSGEYSDYRINVFAKLLKPMNEEAWQEMVKGCSKPPSYDPEGDPRFDEDEAIAWLKANGYIEEVEYVELHLGDYGRAPSWADA